MKKRWLISFTVLAGLCIMGLFIPESPELFSVIDSNVSAADTAWMLTATILVLLMTPGVSFFYGGMVRAKNVISTMLQSFIAMGIISIIWVVFGFSLAFGTDIGGVIGNPLTYFMMKDVGAAADPRLAPTIPFILFALFQLKFAILTPSLITGSFAERVHFSAYLLFMILFAIFVYAPVAHWTWHPDGIFSKWGVLDFAGGLVVHTSSGVAALVGAIFLGKRHLPAKARPANIPFVLLGTAFLWIGWFGFNAGSAYAANGMALKAFINTNSASAVAMLAWVFFDCLRGRKPTAMGAAVGAVVGLVAITPSAGYVTLGESMFIAFITTLVCNIAVYFTAKNIDDALDVFPTHGLGGIIASVFTGVFVNGLTSGNIAVFGHHMAAVAITVAYTFVVSYILYWVVNKMIPMRVSKESEHEGLDRSQHDEKYGMEVLND